MRLIFTMLLLVHCAVSTQARMHLYSRALAEKQVTDSLRAIDSLRVVDSLKVADSMMIARYHVADTALIQERIQKKKDREAAKPVVIDPAERILPDDVDNISARTIVIDQNNEYAHQIDSLQNRVDSICNAIHDNDTYYKNMKTFPVSEKKRYLCYLMQNHLRDTAAVLDCCNRLAMMYAAKLELLIAIRNSQSVNTKSFMAYHIEEQKRRMGELSDFIVALSPAVPYQVQRRRTKE